MCSGVSVCVRKTHTGKRERVKKRMTSYNTDMIGKRRQKRRGVEKRKKLQEEGEEIWGVLQGQVRG